MEFIKVGGNNTTLPMACMCSTEKAFTNTRGSRDNCFHCGCSCKSGANTNAGNSKTAQWRFGKSGDFSE